MCKKRGGGVGMCIPRAMACLTTDHYAYANQLNMFGEDKKCNLITVTLRTFRYSRGLMQFLTWYSRWGFGKPNLDQQFSLPFVPSDLPCTVWRKEVRN